MRGAAAEDPIERWLEARTPRPPDALLTRVAAALRAEAAAVPADRALAAGETMLRRLLDVDCTAREAAPDLLAADALVTYAFEEDAERGTDPMSIDARAAAAMRRVSRLAAG